MAGTNNINIAIVDDEPFCLFAIKDILQHYPYFYNKSEQQLIYSEVSLQVAGCASNAAELMALLEYNSSIQMLLLDYSLTSHDEDVAGAIGQDGALLIKRVLQQWPAIKIIVYTAHKSLAIARLAWQAGAWGIVQKNSNIQELFFAISYIASGRKFFPIELATLSPQEAWDRLSPRETEVLRLLLNGFNQNEIGERLNISFKTVSNTKTRAFKKLGLNSNAEFFKYAHELPI
ncbi:response regulator transcription factor [Serratia sp. AKBS12]|uniref:LuxR C-terminal-related transcriptional regulator n=1 Tax=Serratia sp. AKBS12 TaxID=2974597 RepID=UPI0021660E56|nr:response regulator transcription factor [Serratia sp. AKBS12]MCS3409167.1 response regulator transcription factor [Serratia sp. AKBS12]